MSSRAKTITIIKGAKSPKAFSDKRSTEPVPIRFVDGKPQTQKESGKAVSPKHYSLT
jgi:hypothetical protein